ncbi:MAG: glucokinase [Nannocystaceae bacterium]
MQILAGDVGGTKTDLLLARVDPESAAPVELRSARLASADHRDLAAAIDAFFAGDRPHLDAAAFGIAGPIVDGVCRTTNLPWVIDGDVLAAALALPRPALRLLNDFHALALGVDGLAPSQLVLLQDGPVDPQGPRAIIGAGTGLGEAILVPTAAGPRVLATEGGHADFAPRDAIEDRLLARLRARHDHVSYERLVSGIGIATIYELLVAEGIVAASPAVAARCGAEDPAAVIGELALAGDDPACVATIDRFLRIYGAEAGNLALKVLPSGGLYVAGGIAPRLLPLLREGPFLEALLAKGRMRPLLERLRVAVVTEPRVGLLGAARAAAELLRAPAG